MCICSAICRTIRNDCGYGDVAGVDNGGHTDLLLARSGFRCPDGAFQLQQVPQQLLQANTRASRILIVNRNIILKL